MTVRQHVVTSGRLVHMERRPDEARPDNRPDTELDPRTQLAAEERSELVLGTAEDVLARVPFALGFHPHESLVALAIDAQDRAGLLLRMDLPPPDPPPAAYVDVARQVVAALHQDRAARTLLVIYSDTPPAPALVDELGRTLAADGVHLVDLLRADGRRWWSVLCPNPRCCPPEGQPYELSAHPLTTRSVYRGEVALPDEEELRASVAPLLGLTRLSMTQATARVEDAIEARYARLPGRAGLFEAFVRDGTRYVRELLAHHVDGQPASDPPTDDEAAWASVYVSALPVRDDAWLSMRRSPADRHVRFWRDIARRAVPPYDVAPTALLAFAGWLAGNGPLARCALERALETDPDYSMAHILREVLVRMIPPSVWTSWSEDAARIADTGTGDIPDEKPEAEGSAAA
jgi:hypothetical protein